MPSSAANALPTLPAKPQTPSCCTDLMYHACVLLAALEQWLWLYLGGEAAVMTPGNEHFSFPTVTRQLFKQKRIGKKICAVRRHSGSLCHQQELASDEHVRGRQTCNLEAVHEQVRGPEMLDDSLRQ